jgi:RimJ/RimL family protein N-acetyltransferase
MEILTDRLIIRTAKSEDARFIADLWNIPEVMRFVGFPNGLSISEQQVKVIIEAADKLSLLVVMLKDHTRIGNAKIGVVDENGIVETDVKIIPNYWEQGFGREVKKALVDHIFLNSQAEIVQATPNKNNIASIKMQEYVKAKPVREGFFEFSENMKAYTCPVHYILYHLKREEWKKDRKDGNDV